MEDDGGSNVEPQSRGGSRAQPIDPALEELCGDALLKTIKVPANLANLSSRLPKSNYQRARASEISLQTINGREV